MKLNTIPPIPAGVRALACGVAAAAALYCSNVATASPYAGAITVYTNGLLLSSVTLVDGGSNYTAVSFPATFSGGGGAGAAATAYVDTDPLSANLGKVTNVVLTSAGVGWITAPTIALTASAGSNAAATASMSFIGTNVGFFLNESGGNVTVIYEDGTTNTAYDGVATGLNLNKGYYEFNLTNNGSGLHTGYRIMCFKAGNGTPIQISVNAETNNTWANPRGIAVNKDPKIGRYFGRIYALSSGPGGYSTGPFFKGMGIYMLNPDWTTANPTNLYGGTNVYGNAVFAPGDAPGGNSPWRCRVAPDGWLLVNDASSLNAGCWRFGQDLTNSTLVLAIPGRVAGIAAGLHGGPFGTPQMTGSIAGGDLKFWWPDVYMGSYGSMTLGPNTALGNFNMIYRYDINSGPLPDTGWTTPPVYAYSPGLGGIANLRPEVDIGKDGKIIAGFGRANLSNPDIQVLSPDGSQYLWDSWFDTGGTSDPWCGNRGSGANVGMYGGVRVSPDGAYLVSQDLSSGITLATLTNGIPDDSTLYGFAILPSSQNGRGIDWDIANNIYSTSSGNGFDYSHSLNLTALCVTSNDWTGTNGTFTIVHPGTTATITKIADATQNYTNNVAPLAAGSSDDPAAFGKFRVALATNYLANRLQITWVRGTSLLTGATYGNSTGNYYMWDYYTNANNVEFYSNSVAFPSGNSPTFPANWQVDVPVIATPTPVSGSNYDVTFDIYGDANFAAGNPKHAQVFIKNTGPQLLTLSTINAAASSFYRGNPADFARFRIVRTGDTNGPGNYPALIQGIYYHVTNVVYAGTAVFNTDYKAQVQRFIQGSPLVNGSTSLEVPPGAVAIDGVLGNPVPHTDLGANPANVTVLIALTNLVNGGIICTSVEGFSYTVNTSQLTLNEVDNRTGQENNTYWTDSLAFTNVDDNIPWSLSYACTNLGGVPYTVDPVRILNYSNSCPFAWRNGGTNDFDVTFGYPIAKDGIPYSAVMQQNGWTNALKMTVNKNQSMPAAVNLFPTGSNFYGNYALRFNMYLSLAANAINNNFIPPQYPREYALFGINTYGSNCDWSTILSPPGVLQGTGSGETNKDGVWVTVDAGYYGITPADWDIFIEPQIPNNGGFADSFSSSGTALTGFFKHPPYDSINPSGAGGQPVDQWIDMSFETKHSTNAVIFVNNSSIMTFNLTNSIKGEPGRWTSGDIMLGYNDPSYEESDSKACVYFSNVRVIELSPSVTNSLRGLCVAAGQNFTVWAGADWGTSPVTNTWFLCQTNVGTGTAGQAGVVQTLGSARKIETNYNRFLNSTLTTNLASGTNFCAVFSDACGAVRSAPIIVEVASIANKSVAVGAASTTMAVTMSGNWPSTPTFQWYFNGSALANGTKYANVTTATLTINAIADADAGVYSNKVVHTFGSPVPTGTLTVVDPLLTATVAPATTNALWGSAVQFTVSTTGGAVSTYRWHKDSVQVNNTAGKYVGATTASLTVQNITTTDAGSYDCGVTNIANGLASSAGVMTVSVPRPQLGTVTPGVSTTLLQFTSPNNPFDTTNAFYLYYSPVVTGPYTNVTVIPANAWTVSGSTFSVTMPRYADTNAFYYLLHKP